MVAWRTLALVLSMLWALAMAPGAMAQTQAQDVLDGGYHGIDDALGAAIEIEADRGGFRGTYRDPTGASTRFSADDVDGVAETVLDLGGRTVLMRIVPLPFGAQVAVIPFGADGTLEIASSRLLTFLRDGVTMPETPDDYVNPPRGPNTRIAANGFLVSYDFWPPAGVRDGYLALPERFRTLMRMFPEVQFDVVWKICLAPGSESALAMALRGQGITCTAVIDTVARLQRGGRFAEYKAEVGRSREVLRQSVRCADGYVESRETCAQASRQLSQAAVSLRTAADVLARWR